MGRSAPLYQGFCEADREPQGKLEGRGKAVVPRELGLAVLRSGSCQGDTESPGFMGPQTVLTHTTGLGPTRVHTHSPSLSTDECVQTWTHHSLPGGQASGHTTVCQAGRPGVGLTSDVTLGKFMAPILNLLRYKMRIIIFTSLCC